MIVELLAAGLVLLVAVAVGTVVHELLHAVVLRAAGVGYDLEWLPGTDDSRLSASAFGALASVRLTSVPDGVSPWTIRVASLAPLVLAVPLLAIPLGVVPDPFAREILPLQLLVVGWMACALPSPADFSLVWHADDVVARASAPLGGE